MGCSPASESAPNAEEGGEGGATVSVAQSEADLQLARSIEYHDPTNEWPSFRGTLMLDELRPDGGGRTAELTLDVATGGFEYRADMDGRSVVKTVADGACSATVDGQSPDSAAIDELGLACDRLIRSRDYYLYLWGLPMKLRDPGTIIDPAVTETTFQGEPVRALKVTYDPEVGGDTWYFYFSPQTDALVGYRFYHDESADDGEYITLDGEEGVGSMRLPARRRWFVNADGRFLGEDALLSASGVG